tara:strand:+ start:660 stop:788 length:129 start_codon:yes stop_codon:yes gene_type:complete
VSDEFSLPLQLGAMKIEIETALKWCRILILLFRQQIAADNKI